MDTSNRGNKTVQDALIKSIEKRWANSDQEVFIVAVLLNPMHKLGPFNKSLRLFQIHHIRNLLVRLWVRFYGNGNIPSGLGDEYVHFIRGIEDFFEEPGTETVGTHCSIQSISDMAYPLQRDKSDPVAYYRGLIAPDSSAPLSPLVRLALHIFAIIPNAASCERLFSTLGNILTKRRSRLDGDRLVSLAEIRMHCRDEHIRSGIKKEMKKRMFGVLADSHSETSMTASTSLRNPDEDVQMASASSNEGTIDSDTAPTNEGIEQIVRRFTEFSANHDDEAPSLSESSQTAKVALADLFDLREKYWINTHKKDAMGSLDDELALYEMLDKDAPGEDALDYELETQLDEILGV